MSSGFIFRKMTSNLHGLRRVAGIGMGFGILSAATAYSINHIPLKKVNMTTDATVKTGNQAIPSVSLPKLPNLDFENGPLFDPSEVTVIFVLGGPGVGKGTQCNRLVSEMDFVHLSAGDLLREERARPNSPYGELIEFYIKEGKIVPYEITISLLKNAMLSHQSKSKRFLIDGFPRNVEQGMAFEMAICPSKMVLFFECAEEEMLKRLSARSVSSGRSDDNIESIKKRFRTFQDDTVPVKEFYSDLGKLQSVSCVGSVEEVFQKTKSAMNHSV